MVIIYLILNQFFSIVGILKKIILFSKCIMEDNTSQFAVSLHKLKQKIGDTEINAQTIIKVLKFAMEVVEATQIKGEAQKELATKLVRQIVVDAPISDDKEKFLLDMIDQDILGNTIELIVEATKGELDINAAVAIATTCCMGLIRRA